MTKKVIKLPLSQDTSKGRCLFWRMTRNATFFVQICDERNEAKLLSDNYFVTNLLSRAMILIEKRCKNMYIADLFTAHCDDSLTELNAQGMNVEV